MSNRPFALGGLITDTGVDADHPQPWLRSGCIYDPVRDGALVDAEQTTKWRPLLDAINVAVSASVADFEVPGRNVATFGAGHGVGLRDSIVKISGFIPVSRELLEDDSPGLEADVARWRAEEQARHAREDARHAELLAAGGVVAEIAKLHSPEGDRECAGCDGATEVPPSWPCRTWELLDETAPR